MDGPEDDVTWDEEFDLVVLGAGAAGMTAAIISACEGLQTLLLESTSQIGGTTALSSGTVWIPAANTRHCKAESSDMQAASTYLDALVGDKAPAALRQAFLAAGPTMLGYLSARTDVRFRTYDQSPDYRQDLPGAASGGRPHEPLPFDGRKLGEHFDRVRWPIPELMLFDGMMITRGEAAQLLRCLKSLDSLSLGVRLVGRYLLDRLRFGRGTRLVLGNALAARLFRSLLDRRVEIRYNQTTTSLVTRNARVKGVVVMHRGEQRRIKARRGVVLAGGGFPASTDWRDRFLPQPLTPYVVACDSCIGGTLQLAIDAGAALGETVSDNALWFPCSVAPRSNGSTAVYPHIVLDRAKPGLVAVGAHGKRFVNEAVSYHEFVRAMLRAHQSARCIPALLVCDRRFIWKYGLGMIRPATLRLRSFVDRGYLKSARTLEDLAVRIGVDPTGLAETVREHNAFARTGVDLEFGKGKNLYDRSNGDATHEPNPCIGPINTPPFYAVAVFPTPLGTSLGLRSNEHAQVLTNDGEPMAGLYVCGNDMNAIMGGEYPGAGAQLGPGMTFGYIAARHAAQSSPSAVS